MNGNSEYQERSASELALFAITFVGFVLGATGMLSASGGVAITGVILMAVGIGCFCLRQWIAE